MMPRGAGVQAAVRSPRQLILRRQGPQQVAASYAVKPSLVLVDGHHYVHQAYWAMEGVHNAGVLGFLRKLGRVRRELKPSHLAVMMDEDVEKGWRRKALAAYKSHRKLVPEIGVQLQKSREACEAFGVPWLSKEGYEADDLIGTFAREAALTDAVVHIISPDKDVAQLVGPRVFLHNDPNNPASKMDAVQVQQRWGVFPDQIGDLLALAGDPADCIDGVPGIGLKRAAALLQRHHELEGVLQAAVRDDVGVKGIGPKLRENLRTHADQARRARKIVDLATVPDVNADTFQTDFRVVAKTEQWKHDALLYLERENLPSLAKEVQAEVSEFEAKAVG